MKNIHAHKFPSARIYSQHHRADLVFLGVVIFLSLFGLLMVYDSSQVEAYQKFSDSYHFFKSQALWMVLGFLGLAIFSFIDYHILQKFSLIAFAGSVVLLLLVFVPGLGVEAGGAHRWLKLGITIQPAELIKLAVILLFANLFQKGTRAAPFLITVALVSLIVGLLQKDLGSAIVFNLIAFGIYFVAGGPIIGFLGFLGLGILGFVGFVLTSPYRMRRVLAFLDPFSDPQGFSYHISQVLIALGSGGILGLGIGQSRQKFAYIPEVTTDSIFSVIGEEFGLVGGFVLLVIFGFIFSRGIKIAQNAPDNFGKLLAAGLTIWLGAQAIINLAAMVSLVPLTGVPLPFISYGGSALLANLISVGILINISKQSSA